MQLLSPFFTVQGNICDKSFSCQCHSSGICLHKGIAVPCVQNPNQKNYTQWDKGGYFRSNKI